MVKEFTESEEKHHEESRGHHVTGKELKQIKYDKAAKDIEKDWLEGNISSRTRSAQKRKVLLVSPIKQRKQYVDNENWH